MNKWKGLNSALVKRILGCTLALGLLAATIATSPFSTGAADKVDLTTAINLTVSATSSTDAEFKEDLAKADVWIDYYLIAEAEANKGSDGYTFKLTDTFKNVITLPDTDKDKVTDDWAKEWAEVTKTAAEYVKSNLGNYSIQPYISTQAGSKVYNMPAGLYLLIARGYDIDDYFEMTKPTDGSEPQLVSVAYTDRYKYSFSPELVAMPTKEAVNGVIDTTADTPWIYEAEVFMKPERETRFGSLKIIKDLLEYEDHDPATFIFNVEAKLDGKTCFANVYTLTFTSACEEFVLIDNVLPVGAEVTVTEIYAGPIYQGTYTGGQTVTIVADDIVETYFANTNIIRRQRYGAITNTFDPELDENGKVKLDDNGNPSYTWSVYEDSREEVKIR